MFRFKQNGSDEMKITALILASIISVFLVQSVCAQDITECDIQAGHPSDPGHLGAGRKSGEVLIQLAIPACREAVKSDPANPRFHYQLGRALVYWADVNDGDLSEGLEHLKQAADMDYTQAMFVLGLMYKRQGDNCAAESLTKVAADKGLKSARISYVDDVLGGVYSGCKRSASKEEMAAYLAAAGTQVSGWYESMLLGALTRQIKAAACMKASE